MPSPRGRTVKLLVVGAGPGGLAVAHGLLGHGHAVSVVERSAALRHEGAAVTLWPNGTAVLTALGVPLDGLGRRIDGMDSLDHRGRRLMRTDSADLARRFGTPTLSAPRRQLVQRLADGLPAGTVTFAAECLTSTDHGGQVCTTFADGTEQEADLVVGADGRGSLVRRQTWAEPNTRPTGWVTWQGLTPVPIDVTGSSRILTLLGPNGFVGLQPAGGGLLQWYFTCPPTAEATPAAGPLAPLAALRRRFAGYVHPVPQVLAAITEDDLVAWPHHTHPVPEVWGAGRLTLLGDAAHTMPPGLAQGVNQTLEDAHALTCALDPARVDAGDPAPALRRYEAVRARQVSRIARMSGSEASTTYRPATQLLMRTAPQALTTSVYRRLIEASSFVLHDLTPVGLPPRPA